MQPATMHYAYASDPPLIQPPRAPQNPHFLARGESMAQVYGYNAPSSFDNRYESNEPPVHSQYHVYPGMPSHHTVPSMSHISGNPTRETFGIPYPLPGQTNVSVVHTDDASTKLSDSVRRRCFNCRTTDTSTWRRSNLSPGKVVSSLPLVISILCRSDLHFTWFISFAISADYLSGRICVPGRNSFRINTVPCPDQR